MKSTKFLMFAACGVVLGILVAEMVARKNLPREEAQIERKTRVLRGKTIKSSPSVSTYLPSDPEARSFERPVDEIFDKAPPGTEAVQQVDHARTREEAKKRWEEHGAAIDQDTARSLKRQAKQLKEFRRMARQEKVDDEDNLLDHEAIDALEAKGLVVH